jgi:glycosyltransferase involved in cell wall biosynthesis
MRLAIFHNLPSGGAKRALFEWTRQLAKNHEIDVYTISTADHEFNDIRPYVSKHDVTVFTPRRLFSSPFGRLNQLQRFFDLEEVTSLGKKIAEKIDSGSYDVVFVHTCMFTTIPTVLQFLTTASVYYLHEPFGQNFSREISRPYINQSQWRARLDKFDPFIKLYQQKLNDLQHQSLQKTTLLLANSKFTKEQMEDTHGKKFPVCYCGVDSDSFKPLLRIDRQPFVVSVGEMSPRKGFDFVIESVGCIPEENRPQLKLACNRIDEKELTFITNLAAHHKVDLEVRFGLDSKDLAILYNQAQLCLYAPVKEPFGLVPIEAMACGTPVIGVNEGGVKESVLHQRTGLLVDREVGKFADAVQWLIQEPKLAREFGENGRKHVQENWTWEKSTAKIEHHLESVAMMG